MKGFSALLSLLLPAAIFVLNTGCTSTARRLHVAPVKKIIPSQTTIAEVEKVFGPPHERITGSTGRTIARYYYGEPRLNNHVDRLERRDHPADVICRTLTLLYGPGQVIDRKLHDESLTAVVRYNARFVAGPTLLPANLTFLRSGVTKKAELIGHLGEPTSTSFTVEGAPLLMWFSFTYRPNFVADREMRRLVVELDESLVVRDYAVFENDVGFLRSFIR
jgi:hypothetical protein